MLIQKKGIWIQINKKFTCYLPSARIFHCIIRKDSPSVSALASANLKDLFAKGNVIAISVDL